MSDRLGVVRLLAVALIATWTIGCAAVGPGGEDVPASEPELQSGIWDVEAGERLEADEFFDRLSRARFVVVGESHGTEWHHEVQRRIYDDLVDRNSEVALGLEMIERRFQEAVDEYLASELDEEEMLTAVEWYERWGVDPSYYAPMWRRARQAGQPVVALNARRELVGRVGEVGIDGLDEQQRRALPDIERDDAYREYLRRIFGAHDTDESGNEGLERFFEAQLVWDETMAETAWSFVAGRGDRMQMVLLTGRGHMERGFGIPPRLVRRGADPESVVTVVSVSNQRERTGARGEYRRLDYLRDEEIADFVWIEADE